MSARKQALRWRRQENERGLARVVQRTRGWELHLGKARIASVSPIQRSAGDSVSGWYWHCPSDEARGIGHQNSAHDAVGSPDEAKAECMEYIRARREAAGGAW